MENNSKKDTLNKNDQILLDAMRINMQQQYANKDTAKHMDKIREKAAGIRSYTRPEILERSELLPHQLDVDETDRLLRKVVQRAQAQLKTRAGQKKKKTAGIYGVPDGIVVEEGKITKVIEAKDWEPDIWKKMAELAKQDPENFVKTNSDIKKFRNIQLDKHKHTIQYLQDNLHAFPEARQLGITKKTDINELTYVLKVKTSDPKDSIETIRETYEKQGYRTEVQYVNLEKKLQEFENPTQTVKTDKRKNIGIKGSKLIK